MDIRFNTTNLVINPPQPVFHVIGKCPVTGKVVERGEENGFSIPDGQVIWWNCASCKGWHASVIPQEDNTLFNMNTP